MSAQVLEQPVNTARLRDFVTALAELVESTGDEQEILRRGALLGDLVAHDDWLPEAFAIPDPARYQQYLLHCDSRERFRSSPSLGPGQGTPIHDHTVWGWWACCAGASGRGLHPPARWLAGAGRGGRSAARRCGGAQPGKGDIHRVSNALADAPSISIHVYGANIGAVRRSTLRPMARPNCSSRATPTAWCPICGIAPNDTRPGRARGADRARGNRLIDLREEHDFAQGHPLLPRKSRCAASRRRHGASRARMRWWWCMTMARTVSMVEPALAQLRDLGFTQAHALAGGLRAGARPAIELFEDVNSYSKAFGELVEHRRHTPSLPAPDVQALIEEKADIAILDARRFDEYATMSIPGGVSAPAPNWCCAPARWRPIPIPPSSSIVQAARARIIGAQSLVNAGLPNRVYALRNGTIGWTLAGQGLETGQQRRASLPEDALLGEAAPGRARWPSRGGEADQRAGTGLSARRHGPHALPV
jgi:predicted metal-dependent enzyme (double-stranded beta helix superfamily)/rhodanese-related sulfurtransferase